MKLKTSYRLIAAGIACVVLSASMVVVQRGYSFTVIAPHAQLRDAPTEIGDWTAEQAELTDAEFGVLNAADVASLRFTSSTGAVALMHVATWTDPDEVAETCPHHPGVCYAGNGWFASSTEQVELDIEGVGSIPVEVVVMERAGQRLVIAFTYSMGQHRFSTDTAARLAQTKMWGQSQWPAVTKYLVQVNVSDIESAMPIVDELLGEFIRWHEKAGASDISIPKSEDIGCKKRPAVESASCLVCSAVGRPLSIGSSRSCVA